MTCDLCKRPERREYLEVVYQVDGCQVPANACRRCRMPAKRRPLWDAMLAAEAAVVRDPDDRALYRTLVAAREAFDRSGKRCRTRAR